MNSDVLALLQDEALQAYNRVGQDEAPQWLAALAQLEIAQQLQQANEHLEIIASSLGDTRTSGWLEEIANTLDAIRRVGLPIEKI